MSLNFKDFAVAAGTGAVEGFLEHHASEVHQKKLDQEHDRTRDLQAQKQKMLNAASARKESVRYSHDRELATDKRDWNAERDDQDRTFKTEAAAKSQTDALELAGFNNDSKERIAEIKARGKSAKTEKPDFSEKDKLGIEQKLRARHDKQLNELITGEVLSKEDAVAKIGAFDNQWIKMNDPRAAEALGITDDSTASNEQPHVPGTEVTQARKTINRFNKGSKVKSGGGQSIPEKEKDAEESKKMAGPQEMSSHGPSNEQATPQETAQANDEVAQFNSDVLGKPPEKTPVIKPKEMTPTFTPSSSADVREPLPMAPRRGEAQAAELPKEQKTMTLPKAKPLPPKKEKEVKKVAKAVVKDTKDPKIKRIAEQIGQTKDKDLLPGLWKSLQKAFSDTTEDLKKSLNESRKKGKKRSKRVEELKRKRAESRKRAAARRKKK